MSIWVSWKRIITFPVRIRVNTLVSSSVPWHELRCVLLQFLYSGWWLILNLLTLMFAPAAYIPSYQCASREKKSGLGFMIRFQPVFLGFIRWASLITEIPSSFLGRVLNIKLIFIQAIISMSSLADSESIYGNAFLDPKFLHVGLALAASARLVCCLIFQSSFLFLNIVLDLSAIPFVYLLFLL